MILISYITEQMYFLRVYHYIDFRLCMAVYSRVCMARSLSDFELHCSLQVEYSTIHLRWCIATWLRRCMTTYISRCIWLSIFKGIYFNVYVRVHDDCSPSNIYKKPTLVPLPSPVGHTFIPIYTNGPDHTCRPVPQPKPTVPPHL